jgi:serine/threonine protein kinase
MVPTKIGRYEIVAELGRGAMGVVYRAKDPAIGRIVALKTLRLDNSAISHDELVKRFQQEARAAGALNHRNIVTIYDAGESEETFYIAMEYLEGQTLAELLRKQRTLHPDTVAEIGQQVCAGLAYAHQHGVVHRDIKPANIMITNDSVAKIMDFGIAKVEASLTMTGQVVGTPDYMSPEQVKGNRLDGRSDLFSLGVILYEMATGERPFVGQSVTTIMYKIVHEAPVPPEKLDSSVPEGLGGIIMRGLAKAPEARYQTAQQMGEGLRDYDSQPAFDEAATVGMTALSWQAPPPPQTQPPTAPPSFTAAPHPYKRRKRFIWIGGFVLLLVLGIKFCNRSGKEIPTQKTQQAHENTGTPATPQPSEPEQPAQADSSHAQHQEPQHAGDISVTVPGAGSIKVPAVPDMSNLSQYMGADAAEKVKSALQGQFVVTSEPPGAKVTLDGNPVERPTPTTLTSVPVGAHAIDISMPGFQTMHMNVAVVPGQTTPIRATLVPVQGPPDDTQRSGQVQLQTKPSGATVDIKGPVQFVNLTTPTVLTLPPGQYELIFLHDNYLPLKRNFEIKAGRTTKIKESLKTRP